MKQIKNHPARFCVEYEGVNRKIFSYFCAANDTSIAVHTYLSSREHGVVHMEGDIEKVNNKNIVIDEVDKIEGKVHKINIHKSGHVSQKDKKGNSFEINIKSLEFEKIEDAINLAFLQPTDISAYPEVESGKDYIDLICGNKNMLPPVVQFYLVKNDFSFDKFTKEHKDGVYVKDAEILKQYDISLILFVRKHKSETFPKAEALGLFKY